MKATHRIVLALAGLTLSLTTAVAAPATWSGAATSGSLRATFVDIYSSCPTSPPSVVFCGHGTVAGVGSATSVASLTGIAPIAGTDCLELSAIRTITLDSGSGSLTLNETGTLCPPSAQAGNNAVGSPYTVAKTYTVAAGTGIFAGATGSGSDINRSAGNSQVSVLSGTLTAS